MSFRPIRIDQDNYKKAAADIQRNFDEISKLLLPVKKPLSINSGSLSINVDINTLDVDGNGRLYSKGWNGDSGTINIYAPANWPAAIADHPILFLDSDSGNLMIRMPTNAPFNGEVREINTSEAL